ncbi:MULTISPECIES: BrnT family toxin [Moorena]|uniref:BrnT family toxin n=1 Tax=Moorena producens (strain JHB) TaxID=1454205 RepID=A0A9Q9UWV8_MOOP1|nr:MULTISPECIES: BrnT family toxin [Moorena]WAN70263.1 BrnT family toxin [Moorena producens JHB]
MQLDALGRVLVVVYTWRGDQIRLISTRKATRTERKQYLEG